MLLPIHTVVQILMLTWQLKHWMPAVIELAPALSWSLMAAVCCLVVITIPQQLQLVHRLMLMWQLL